MGLNFNKKPAKASAQTTISEKGKPDVVENEKVDVPAEVSAGAAEATAATETGGVDMANQIARVRVGMGYTHNLGNFQSARIDVSIEIPCLVTEIDGVYDFAENWANARLEKAIEAFGEAVKG